MKCRTHTYTSIGIPNRGEERDFSKLDPLWVSQFVGWFHGEGSVRIRGTNKGTYVAGCAIKLRADDQAVLKDIQEHLGGRFVLPKVRKGHSPEAFWEVTNTHDLKAVLELIRDNTLIPARKLQDVLIVLEFVNWRLSQTYHNVDWSYAVELKKKLQESRVFKVLGEG